MNIDGIKKRNVLWIDPRTKLLMLVFIGIVALSVPTLPIILEILLFLTPVIFLIAYGIRLTTLKASLCFGGIILVQTFFHPAENDVIYSLILGLLSVIRMFLPIVMVSTLLVRTTTVSEFLSAFRKMHIPDTLIIPLSVMFRFIPTITDEWKSISSAMRFRGIGNSFIDVVTKPMLTLEYMLVPLLMSTSTIAEELAAASLARGLDVGVERTSIKEVHLGMMDWLLVLIMLALGLAVGVGIF